MCKYTKINTVLCKSHRRLEFSGVIFFLKSVISIFCCSVSVGNIVYISKH